MKYVRNFIPLVIILIALVVLWWLDLDDYLNYETYQKNRGNLRLFADQYPLLAPVVVSILYAFLVMLSLPFAFMLSVVVGFLFPQPTSTIVAVVGCTVGAVLIFLVAKTALRSFFEKLTKGFVAKMQHGFEENSVSYLLLLRIVPIFPFWIVNIAPAFLNVPVWTFAWTTFVGVVPWSFIYTEAGQGFENMFLTEDPLSFLTIFSKEMVIGLIGALIIAIIPFFLSKKPKLKKD